MSFSAGDLVFLKVSPMKGVMRYGKKEKLAPRYIGPFEIWSTVGEVANKLVLTPELSRVHPVFFHVPMMRKYISDPSYVLQPQAVELSEDLTYEEYPVAIVDRQVCRLCTKHTRRWKFYGVTTQQKTARGRQRRWCGWVILFLFQFWNVPPFFIKFEDEFL